MENKKNKKAPAWDDSEKLAERVLSVAANKIIERIKKLETENKKEHREMKGDIREMKGDIREMKGEMKEMKGEMKEMKGDILDNREIIMRVVENIEEMRKEILDGQDTMVKLIEDKNESEAMDVAARRRCEEKIDDHEKRIENVEARVGILA